MNRPPSYCPYCASPVTPVGTPVVESVDETTAYRCEECDDFVFYNPTPGGSAIVLDGDSVLLVEDFRTPGEWKLPSGRMELGESPREGVARELEEETGLAVDPHALVYVCDESGEPAPGQYMVGIDYAIRRADTTGTLAAGSDATDAQFFTPDEFEASEHVIKDTHVDRFGTDSVSWLVDEAKNALDG